MTTLAIPLFLFLFSYLLGAIPFGYLIAKSRGVDILSHGSGNIGATNVGRILGRRLGILVFLLDFAKGAVPAAVGSWLDCHAGLDLLPSALGVGSGLAAILGHLFPIYLRFKGGKGVATGAGVVVVLLPLPFFLAICVWIVVLITSRYVSLASILAAVSLVLMQFGTSGGPFASGNVILTLFCLLASLLIIARHRTNLLRLVQGRENRVKENRSMFVLTKIVHVLALGLWFGTSVFFSFIVGQTLFAAFEEVTAKPAAERPNWLPVPAEYDRERPSDKFPDPLRKEQGSRLFGTAVGPLFPRFFGIQAVCGLLALATALSWTVAPNASWPKLRVAVLLVALLTVAGGWWLEQRVDELRQARTKTTDAVLSASQPSVDQIHAAEDGRADFGRWHTYSLLLNFVTISLVTIAMGLTAVLPTFSSKNYEGQ
ncbi:MAG: glycerol-3-phosphate 1-O-acyltransferase PlsY [Gemmataceae bacterium]